MVHGGLIATLLDSALGCSIHTMLPVGTGYTTLELHVNFVRPLTRATGEVRCEANVLHVGKRLGTAEAKVFDSAGKLYGHGTTTCMIAGLTALPALLTLRQRWETARATASVTPTR